MLIVVHLDRARLFRWQLALAEALRDRGHTGVVQFRATSEPLPVSLTSLLDFDAARLRTTRDRFSALLRPADFAKFSSAQSGIADLEIDLSTVVEPAQTSKRTLRPNFDGSPKDHALYHALLASRAPDLTVADSAGGVWPIGLPALETPARLAPSLDQTASRLVEGLVLIVARLASAERPPQSAAPVPNAGKPQSVLSSATKFASKRMASKLSRAGDRVTGDAPKWHVAWRKIADAELPQPGILKLSAFHILPDDGKRFYADPFAFAHEGKTHVFVEEFPDHTQKGIISHVTISDDGVATQPFPVLDEPHHLSYPQVFAEGGEIWMLPEASSSGGLNLYRAEQFPDRWVKAARILNEPVHDATLFSHLGHCWIAASTTAHQSSSWDSLALFWSDKLLGPWRPHARNPVLIDAKSARPAGALWQDGESLIRAAQDCSQNYGGQITLKRITGLDPRRFDEVTIGTLSFAPESRILGPHTFSRAGNIELIDLYARPSFLRAGS